MNRLQKKCAIATAGIHLLLLTILVVGPAFFSPQPKATDTQVLDVIPANLIDAALNSGIRGATPPAPAPVVVPPPQPVPPTPVVQPAPTPPAPKPVVTPQPSIPEKLAQLFEPKPKPVKPATETPETQAAPNPTESHAGNSRRTEESNDAGQSAARHTGHQHRNPEFTKEFVPGHDH